MAPREMTKEYIRGLHCKVIHRRKIKPNCSDSITLRSNGCHTEGGLNQIRYFHIKYGTPCYRTLWMLKVYMCCMNCFQFHDVAGF